MFEQVITDANMCKPCLQLSAGEMLKHWPQAIPAGQSAERVYGRIHDWVFAIRRDWLLLNALFTYRDLSSVFKTDPAVTESTRTQYLGIWKYV